MVRERTFHTPSYLEDKKDDLTNTLTYSWLLQGLLNGLLFFFFFHHYYYCYSYHSYYCSCYCYSFIKAPLSNEEAACDPLLCSFPWGLRVRSPLGAVRYSLPFGSVGHGLTWAVE